MNPEKNVIKFRHNSQGYRDEVSRFFNRDEGSYGYRVSIFTYPGGWVSWYFYRKHEGKNAKNKALQFFTEKTRENDKAHRVAQFDYSSDVPSNMADLPGA